MAQLQNSLKVRTFLKNYIDVKTSNSSDLKGFLSPLPKTTEMLSHADRNLLQSFDRTEAFYYISLVFDVIRLCYGAECENQEPESAAILPESGDLLQNIAPEVALALTPDRNESEDVDVIRTDWDTWRSRLQEMIIRSRDSQATPEQVISRQQLQSTPLSSNIRTALAAHSTPNRPEPLMLPSSVDRNVIRPIAGRAPPLPTIRDDQPEFHRSNVSGSATAPHQIRDYIRRRSETTRERLEFDEPLESLRDLQPDPDARREMEEYFTESRRERMQRYIPQQRREPLRRILTLDPLPALNITTAVRVANYDEYFFTETQENYNNVEIVLERLQDIVRIVANVQYRQAPSVDGMRGGSVASGHTPLHRQQPIQQSVENTSILIHPEIQQSRTNEPQAIDSLPLEPILVPEFIERLIDTDPVIIQMDLRPRNESNEGIYAGQDRPRRRIRRRIRGNPRVIDMEQGPESDIVEAEQRISAHPMSQQSTSQMVPINSEQIDLNLPETIDMDTEYIRRKLQDWRDALVSKCKAVESKHEINLMSAKETEKLSKEAEEVTNIISQNAFLSVQHVVPPGIDKKKAVQRFSILLELHMKNAIELERDAGCAVVGLKNLTLCADNSRCASVQSSTE